MCNRMLYFSFSLSFHLTFPSPPHAWLDLNCRCHMKFVADLFPSPTRRSFFKFLKYFWYFSRWTSAFERTNCQPLVCLNWQVGLLFVPILFYLTLCYVCTFSGPLCSCKNVFINGRLHSTGPSYKRLTIVIYYSTYSCNISDVLVLQHQNSRVVTSAIF